MKTLILSLLVVALFPAASNISAQTLKWEYSTFNQRITRNGDGFGGYVICERLRTEGQWGRCVWISASGRVQFTNDFQMAADFDRCDIVRLNPRELAIRFRTYQGTNDAVVNVLRRFKKTGRGIAVSDTVLLPNEQLPLAPPQDTDPFGFTSSGQYLTEDRQEYFSIRRYSN
jgi:hypothetical protein